MKEKIDKSIEPIKKVVIIETGCGQMLFRRNKKGQIVYDEEGRIPGGGYPYVTIARDVVATKSDIEELLKSLLPFN